MSLGTNISRLRAEKRLSQGDLAEVLEVSRQSVSKWETDSSVPDLDKLIKLSQLFRVTLDELVTGAEPQLKVETPPVMVSPSMPGRKIAGIILFCMAFLAFLIPTVLGGILVGLILAVPFLVCGIICFLVRKRPGLWCAWAAYLAVYIFLCQVGTKKILRIYKPFIGGQPPVNGLRFLYALLPFFVRRFLYAVSNASIIGVTGSSLSGLDRYSNRMPFSLNFRSNLMKEETSRLIREVSRARIVPMP